MNFLIDTNIIIPLDPVSSRNLAANVELAARFNKLTLDSHSTIFIHPAIIEDIKRDRNDERRLLRNTLIQKYKTLESVPDLSILDKNIVGLPERGSNDWVDNNLLAALKGDLVDYLVTEDTGIHKKAKRLLIESRVLFLADAIELIKDLFDKEPSLPPKIHSKFVYELNDSDSIFNSLRSDYPGFDSWLRKCKTEQRKAFVVNASDSNNIAAIAILKREDSLPDGREGKILKICTFKVSSDFSKNRFGELLFKAIFDYIFINKYKFAYFTVYEKHSRLIELAEDFGFYRIKNSRSEEEVALCKELEYNFKDLKEMNPFEFHVKFGPKVTSFNGNSMFIIPVKPVYHDILFPELNSQGKLFPSQCPCGNSIRKAYLSHSSSRKLKNGDNIIFYRSGDKKALTCIGIVEDTLRSEKTEEIVKYVGSRTVYTISDIKSMCLKPVLAIKFIFIRPVFPEISLNTMRNNMVINGHPQSITEISKEGIEWIKKQIEK